MPSAPATTPWSPAQQELMEVCLRILSFLGLPKSAGRVYAALFTSSRPLDRDSLMHSLGLSKGSTHQALHLLLQIGAAETVFLPGARRDHFRAQTNLEPLVNGFLHERVQPALRDLDRRLSDLEHRPEMRAESPRLKILRRWQRKAASASRRLGTVLTDPAP